MAARISIRLLSIILLSFVVGAPFYVVHASIPVTNGVIANFADSLLMPVPAIPLPSPAQLTPVSGVLRVLVIAAAFSDVNVTKSTDQLKQEFFGTVGNYYKEISYGAITLQGDVVGWYKLNYSMVYYGRDCNNVDDSDCSGTPTSWWLARDAVAAANKDPNVHFNNYDYFVFIHTGVGEESARGINKDTVWSVAYLAGIWLRTKDKSIGSFAILPESEAQGAVPIGVYAHEFGHLIGLPDLYDTLTGRSILGPWSLMDKGLWNGNPPGSSPSEMEAWSKIRLGWLNGSLLAIANDGSMTNYTIQPMEVASSGVHAIKIPISTNSPPTQYYLVEVRQQIGFDSGLPSSGVLITSVDERAFNKKLAVVDGHPSIPGLADATWHLGQVFTDEKNNIAIAVTGQAGNDFQVTVNRIGPLPDLAVTKISTQPTEMKPNDTVTILIDIANQGTAPASNVPVQIFLDGQPFANQQIALTSGASTEIKLTWIAVSGAHTLRVLIDPYDALNELNKANDQAIFSLNVGPTLIITVPLNVTTGNTTTWVRVNGILYNITGSELKTSVAAGLVTIEVASAVLTSNASRQLFIGWSDGNAQNPRQITVANNTSISARYKSQYLLTVNSSGGVTSPSGWFDANASVTVTATSPSNVVSQSSRMLFAYWSGDIQSYSSTVALNLTKPFSLKAHWKVQYFLIVVSSFGSPIGAGWYDAGSIATVTIQSPTQQENNTRQVFAGWNGTNNGQETTKSIVISSPTLLEASWKRQYLVQVRSVYGTPQGSGWHDAGIQTQISIESEVNYRNNTRRVFAGWAGDYSGRDPSFTLNVDSPKVVTAQWTTQYELTFKVEGIPNSTAINLKINNANHGLSVSSGYTDWFNRGSFLDVSANQTIMNGFLQMNGLYNSTGGIVESPIDVTGPMVYTIKYQSGFSLLAVPGFSVESILVGMTVGLLSVAMLSRRRARVRPC